MRGAPPAAPATPAAPVVPAAWRVLSARTLPGPPAPLPPLNGPKGVALTPDGKTLFVADSGGCRIWSCIPLATEPGRHSWRLLAGSASPVPAEAAGFADGRGVDEARFNHPVGLVVHGSRLLVADAFNHRIRSISPIIVAGGGGGGGAPAAPPLAAEAKTQEDQNEDGQEQEGGNTSQHVQVTTLCGGGAVGAAMGSFADGAGADARLNEPYGMALAADGARVLICDQLNQRVRALDLASSTLTTFAGTGAEGETDGPGTAATFFYPTCVAAAAGHPAQGGAAFIADRANNGIRGIRGIRGIDGSSRGDERAPDTGSAAAAAAAAATCTAVVVETVAGGGGLGAGGMADGATGSEAKFCMPFGVAMLPDGQVLVSDNDNHALRCVVPGSGGGRTYTLLPPAKQKQEDEKQDGSTGPGGGGGGGGDDGAEIDGTSCTLRFPACMAVETVSGGGGGGGGDHDDDGCGKKDVVSGTASSAMTVRVYIADEGSSSIKVVTLTTTRTTR